MRLADGWLFADELAALDLTGALVTLAACESGRSRMLAGEESLGLARSLLAAGAAGLVVSGWRVADASAARIMAAFYDGVALGRAPVAALRHAALAERELRPHPYHWAAFRVIGGSRPIVLPADPDVARPAAVQDAVE